MSDFADRTSKMSETQSITSTSDSDLHGTSAVKDLKDSAQRKQLLQAASSSLLNNTPKDAAEKFKTALDTSSGKSIQNISAVDLILRYALCIAWIKCNEYRDIVRAIEFLKELIQCGHGAKLPALYLALAQAYFALNRFKAALDPIGKGLKVVNNNAKIKQYPWPGSQKIIDETIRDTLQKSLQALQRECGAYRPPDVTCRYGKCLSFSKHIIPSENIYFTDPDFLPFITLHCQSKCKISYHDLCWKQLKHENPDIEKYKDMLGQPCPTENCMISDNDGNNTRSLIVEIKLIGKVGFDNPSKSWIYTDNSSKHPSSARKQSKVDNTSEKIIHTKDKTSAWENSNGSPDKRASCITEVKEFRMEINEPTKGQLVPKQSEVSRLVYPATAQAQAQGQVHPSFYYQGLPAYPVMVVGPPAFYPSNQPGCLPSHPPPPSSLPAPCFPVPHAQTLYPTQPPYSGYYLPQRFVAHPIGALPQPLNRQRNPMEAPKVGMQIIEMQEPMIKSVVTDLKRLVTQLAGENYSSTRKGNSASRTSIGEVVNNIKDVVHKLGGDDSKEGSLKEISHKIRSSSPQHLPSKEAASFVPSPLLAKVVEQVEEIEDSSGEEEEEGRGCREQRPMKSLSSQAAPFDLPSIKDALEEIDGSGPRKALTSKAPPFVPFNYKGSLEGAGSESRKSLSSNATQFVPACSNASQGTEASAVPSGSSTLLTPPFQEKEVAQDTEHVDDREESNGFKKPVSLLETHSFEASQFSSFRTLLSQEKQLPSAISDHSITLTSPLQAKVKSQRPKEKKVAADHHTQSVMSIVPPVPNSFENTVQEPTPEEKLASCLQTLKNARRINFGYTINNCCNPELQYFGRQNIQDMKFTVPGVDEDYAEFVFSYHHSILENDGPQKMEDLEERWKRDCPDYALERFFDKYTSICTFLLQSPRFAAIEDQIGTSELLPEMYSREKEELTESTSFLLFQKVQKPCSKNDCESPDSIMFDSSKGHSNNSPQRNSHRTISSTTSSPESDDIYDEELDSSVADDLSGPEPITQSDMDMNENQMNGNSSLHSSSSSSMEMHARNNNSLTGNNNCPPQEAEVYMSDDDEVLVSTLDDLNNEESPDWSGGVGTKYGNDDAPQSPVHSSDVINENVMASTQQKSVLEQGIQTDSVVDSEKEMLLTERDAMKRENSELKYIKDELQQRIATLQSQMETIRAGQEKQYSKALKQAQEKMEQKLESKKQEIKELESKVTGKDASLSDAMRLLKEKENQINEQNEEIKKLRMNHAKEINHVTASLREESLGKDSRIRDLEKIKEMQNEVNQRFLHLWKEYSDYKVLVFNQKCTERIGLLTQLRDMVSDNVSPTKSEITMSIQKHEDVMITVAKKNQEINELVSREGDRLKKGLPLHYPQAITLPVFSDVPYPMEAALEYLSRCSSSSTSRPEEMHTSRHSYSPAYSPFYGRQIGMNGTSFAPVMRETEPFSQPYIPLKPQADQRQLWSSNHFSPNPSLFENSTLPAAPSPFASSSSIFGLSSPNTHIMPGSTSRMPGQVLSMHDRSTPSPIPMPNQSSSSSVNGAASVIAKPLPIAPAAIGKPAAATSNAPAFPATGAIPKVRPTPTATAAMTPIVPSKVVRPPMKAPAPVPAAKIVESSYQKLMRSLQKMFPTRNDAELTQALKMAREKNNNTLSSLSHAEIVAKVEDILNKHFKKQTAMGLEKFGQAAWGTAKPTTLDWEGSVTEECIICTDSMSTGEVYTLQCKHAFHTKCIREWLARDSVCPNCRKHSTMQDEFPPLG